MECSRRILIQHRLLLYLKHGRISNFPFFNSWREKGAPPREPRIPTVANENSTRVVAARRSRKKNASVIALMSLSLRKEIRFNFFCSVFYSFNSASIVVKRVCTGALTGGLSPAHRPRGARASERHRAPRLGLKRRMRTLRGGKE